MNAFLDIVLLGLAVFAVWKLYSTFGRRTGFERNEQPSSVQAKLAEVANQAQPANKPTPADPFDKIKSAKDEVNPAASTTLATFAKQDKTFTIKNFFYGARSAYKIVVEAFARGDKEALDKLLHANVAKPFGAAIQKLEKLEHQSFAEVKNITEMKILSAQMPKDKQDKAKITLEIKSQQLAWTKDKEGRIISGDPNILREISDIWTFAKSLSNPNPNWLIVATGK